MKLECEASAQEPVNGGRSKESPEATAPQKKPSSRSRAKGGRRAVGDEPTEEDLIAIANAQIEMAAEAASHACAGRAGRGNRQSGRHMGGGATAGIGSGNRNGNGYGKSGTSKEGGCVPSKLGKRGTPDADVAEGPESRRKETRAKASSRKSARSAKQ